MMYDSISIPVDFFQTIVFTIWKDYFYLNVHFD